MPLADASAASDGEKRLQYLLGVIESVSPTGHAAKSPCRLQVGHSSILLLRKEHPVGAGVGSSRVGLEGGRRPLARSRLVAAALRHQSSGAGPEAELSFCCFCCCLLCRRYSVSSKAGAHTLHYSVELANIACLAL